MDKTSMTEKISEGFQRTLVDCIRSALEDDLPRYMSEFQPKTTNGIPHQIGDWINTNITNRLTNGNVDVMTFNRYSWRGKIIIDNENMITYSIMRIKRLHHLRKEKREKPHYLQSIVSILNQGHSADLTQGELFEGCSSSFDEDTLCNDFDSIFEGRIDKEEGYHHCVVAYDTEHHQLCNVKIWFLDGNLNVFEELSLNEYIKPDFAQLTKLEPAVTDVAEEEQSSSAGLLSLRTVIKSS